MSPLAVRRYRAERLLREEFERLRRSVLATVGARLRARGVSLDSSDLEACYAQAWQGLYAAVLEGEEIANPSGWLVLVTFRRAIDEDRCRARVAAPTAADDGRGVPDGRRVRAERAVDACERDLAAELDDVKRLRQLFEGLRVRLSARELQAATLCYLQGMPRADAAARMGVSEARMRKLMDGPGAGRPGVAAKVGVLVETIRNGGWCDEQGSLMRGLAYGILDPQGERHRLALIHSEECPACRAYVASLRGLAAVLPPAPSLVRWALAAGAATGKGTGAATGAVAGSGAAGGSGAGTLAAGGGGALSVPAGASAGAGAAGGSWLLAGGPLGAKLAAGCLLALGLGAGCVALSDHAAAHAHVHEHRRARLALAPASQALSPAPSLAAAQAPSTGGELAQRAGLVSPVSSSSALASTPAASREFGPEQTLAPGGAARAASSTAGRSAPSATAASASEGRAPVNGEAEGRPQPPSSHEPPSEAGSQAAAAGGDPGSASAAEREFAPG